MKFKLLLYLLFFCTIDTFAVETTDTIAFSNQNITNSRVFESQSTIVVSDVSVSNTGAFYILTSGTVVFSPLFSVALGGILETGHGSCLILYEYDNSGDVISRNKEFVEE